MKALQECHAQYPYLKFVAACNDQKHALNLCLREEVSQPSVSVSVSLTAPADETRNAAATTTNTEEPGSGQGEAKARAGKVERDRRRLVNIGHHPYRRPHTRVRPSVPVCLLGAGYRWCVLFTALLRLTASGDDRGPEADPT
jgi:hypothetical protein